MEVKEKSQSMRIGGASIAWITLYGALCGVTSLIPVFPYVGGGGYVPLQTMFSAIAPVLLGGVGGMVAATVGGVIGMFIAPAAFPLQLVDVILTGTLPAFAVWVMMEANKRGWLALLWTILVGIIGSLFPFYVPGAAAGFAQPANPVTYFLLVAYYWVIPLIIILIPLGKRLMPDWIRGTDRKNKYIGLFLTYLVALLTWFLPWSLPYWYVYTYEPSMGVATLIGYTWWVPLFSLAITIITVPLVEALRRSGLPKIPGAIW
ncbi:MAG: hypothetical protein JW726_16965 [Anaerolineales bacterium]|nr:hypothetical protein [Anaerolineales bacterium]